jgi:hypothetical protein
MHAAAEAAVGAGDDIFSPDDFSKHYDAIGEQFRVLDEIGGVAGDATMLTDRSGPHDTRAS